MQGTTKERWRDLCEQATSEKDPKRFFELVQEINRLLADKDQRLRQSAKFGTRSLTGSNSQESA
jgi:hypothetical protein